MHKDSDIDVFSISAQKRLVLRLRIGWPCLSAGKLCEGETAAATGMVTRQRLLFRSLQRKVIIIIICLSFILPTYAQTAASYGFSAFLRQYNPVYTSGFSGPSATTNIINGYNKIHVIPYPSTTFPFPFTFCGVSYTHLYVCTNGFVSFTNDSSTTYTNLADSITGPGMLMPFWDRLYGSSSGGAWNSYYQDTGTSPNRVFIFEWGDNGWFPYSYPTSGSPGRFQIRLYETSNIIEFCYDSAFGGTIFTGTSATIGIANSTTDWQTLNNTSGSPTPSFTVFTDSLSVGPAHNQVYRWNPNPCTGTPAAGTASATITTGCAVYTSVLTITGAGSTGYGIGYQWQSSPDSITWTVISGATSTACTVSVTATSYYRCVSTCSLSGLSAPCPGIKLNLNSPPASITGITTLCAGSSITLSDATAGGSWSSSNTSVATIGSMGIVNAISTGTSIITYTLPTGCFATGTITINPVPVITGGAVLCVGSALSLGSSVTGGTWSSSNPSVATIGSVSGIVAGSSNGIDTITYNIPTGCHATINVTVNVLPSTITGPSTVCAGSNITLSDATTGGTWTSMDASVATVGSTGVVTGITPGTALIMYTLPTGCSIGKTITVNVSPSPIAGLPVMCVGATSTVTDITSGGIWSGGAGIVSIGSSSGVITGLATGTANITYTLADGCFVTAVATVNTSPSAITGSPIVCLYLTSTLSDSITGGNWTSSDYTTADVVSTTGVVTGLTLGTATITYTLPASGCFTSEVISVNPAPSAISGLSMLCRGTSSLLFDAVSGGLWSSGSPGVVSINSVTGVDSALTAGVATINYSTGTGCTVSFPVTVNPQPAAITGAGALCVGATATLTDATTGGTWSSTSPVATIIGSTGVVTGVSAGTVLISYTSIVSGCAATAIVTVYPLPGPILGAGSVCPGAVITLGCGAGGTWSSGSPAIGTIGASTGIVTGISAGVDNITCIAATGCMATTTITVNTSPAPITGTASVCVGQTTTMTDATTGGSWSKSNTNITIGSGTGTVTGVTTGTTIITYTGGTGTPSAGCIATKTMSINGSPSAIGGAGAVCVGATTLYTDATAGGTWSPATGGIATAGSTGLITGIAAGSATISYTMSTGCYAIKTITVNPLPTMYGVTGGGSYCAGGLGLHVGLAGSVSGTSYQLYNGTTAGAIVASTGSAIDFGNQTAAGTYTIMATTAAGCSRAMTGSVTITINPLPGPITGPTALCVGATGAESDSATGGVWSGGSASVSVGSVSGVVTGLSTGSGVITYTLPTSCYTMATINVTTGTTAISGSSTVCAGAAITLTDGSGGGVWSSSTLSHATIGSLSGVVTGVAAGTTTITYSLGSGCTATKIITVNASPMAIAGAGAVCVGATITESDGTTGGIWSAGAGTGSMSVGSGSGIVTGISAGTDTVYYTALGCAAIKVITVNATPTPIGGSGNVCAGATITESDGVGGGVWSAGGGSGSVSVGSGSGVVTGVSSGTAGITYAIGGCTTSRTITVNPNATISGATGICTGSTSTLGASISGGTWQTIAGSVSVGSGTGVVSGLSVGSSVITYTTPAGCASTVTVTVASGAGPISGAGAVCVGAQITLTDGTTGGIWSAGTGSGSVSVGSSSGVVTGVSAGTAVITYSMGSGCTVTATVTVNNSPAAITGPVSVCAGSTIALTDATAGGVWSASAGTGMVSAGSTGVVTGVSAGSAIVSYSIGLCAATKNITVNPLPATIAGSAALCAGLTTNWSDAITGGTWSGGAGSASVGSGSGVVTGLSAGTGIITYTLPTGCQAIKAITINAAPVAITGSLGICVGSTTLLSDATPGGSWSSSNSLVALAGSTGSVMGVNVGMATISYVVGGCPALAVVTVSALPAAIAGAGSVCAGATTTLSDGTSGGTWSSSNALIASVGSTGSLSGLVTGVAVGSATISYSLGVGCTVSKGFTVNALPAAITGGSNVCVGGTITLTDTASGGVWSTSAGSVSIGSATGIVTGISGGSATISYYVSSIGCAATHVVTAIAVPEISGVHNICAYGDTMTVSDAVTTGLYTSTLATVTNLGGGLGRVSGSTPGTASVTYIVPSGCTASTTFTVNVLPAAISGIAPLCVGGTETVTDISTGGVWSAVAGCVTIGSSSGLVTAVSAGTGIISYTLPATGCSVDSMITVLTLPNPGVIMGADNVCAGGSIALSDTVTGGAWSSVGTMATVGSTGTVTGVIAGVDTINYTVSNMCGSMAAARAVTINPLPDAGVITGRDSVCVGNEVTLTESAAGGVWSMSNANARIDTTGLLGGIVAGMDTVIYTVSNAWCSSHTEVEVTVFGSGNCPALGNVEMRKYANVQIWPNPSGGEVEVRCSEAGILSVYNIQGQKVGTYNLKAGENEVQLDAGIADGVYLMEYTNNNGVRSVMHMVIAR